MANAINSLNFGSNTYTFTLPYGTCSTAAGTAAKTVDVDNFSLETGARVLVKFTVTNTAASPTLNVESTGAKAIYYRGSAISAGYLAANRTYEFVYNGTQWDLIGDLDTNTTYSAAGSSLGLVKSGGDVTISSGTITVNDDSHNHTIANVDNLQSSLDAKQNTVTGAATTITGSNLTASRALVSDGNGKVAVSAVTSTELGYLDGVTSNIQTQLSGKAASSHNHAASNITSGTLSSDRLPTVPIAKGGTGATDAASARFNLGITLANLGAAASSHTHSISNVTNLQSSLDGKLSKTGGSLTGALKIDKTAADKDSPTGQDFVINYSLPSGGTLTEKNAPGIGFHIGNVGWANFIYDGTFKFVNNNFTAYAPVKASSFTGALKGNADTATNVAWSGVTSKPSYYDAKAIKGITRSGTTFTYTCMDGTTGTFTQQDNNTTYSAATQSAQGLMSAADKKKLDGIATGANAYTLPTASSSTLGGVKTTSTVTSTSGLTACPIIGGVPYYKDTNTTYSLSSFGVTATAAELNILDGVTATATELNYCDGVTANIQTQLNNKANSSHTHNYAGSSSAGGSATSAVKLDTATAGSATQPVYFTGGKPVACTYKLQTSVPSNAKFTDTTYTLEASGYTISLKGSNNTSSGVNIPDTFSPITTAGNGSTYTATSLAIGSLTTGIRITIVPHVASASTTPTLNLNNFGAKQIRRRLSNLSTSAQAGYTNTWLAKGKPYTLIYDGSYWIVEGLTKPAVADLYGNVPITKGGTGATTAAAALSNLGITYGTSDLVAGSSSLTSGAFYFVYE